LPVAENLATRLQANQRESILEWLVQACEIMRLQDGVLFSTVLMLDRYCSVAEEPLPMERMQKVLMAVICTVLKTCTVSDEVPMPLQELLLHLCRRQVNFQEILAMEHKVLQTLQFSGLSAPTPLDFLDAFCTCLLAYGEPIESSAPRSIANFVVQLSLFNANMHYRYPHSILAAAGVSVALSSLQVPPVVHHTLLHDVMAICPEIPDTPACVAAAAAELHGLWLEFASTQGNKVPCLLRKFAGSRLSQNMILQPPAVLASIPSPAWSPAVSSSAESSSLSERPRRQAAQDRQPRHSMAYYGGPEANTRRFDPMLGEAVTYHEMLRRHTETGLGRGLPMGQSYWESLQVVMVGSQMERPHMAGAPGAAWMPQQQQPTVAHSRTMPTRAW